jgi:hypothetical protein
VSKTLFVSLLLKLGATVGWVHSTSELLVAVHFQPIIAMVCTLGLFGCRNFMKQLAIRYGGLPPEKPSFSNKPILHWSYNAIRAGNLAGQCVLPAVLNEALL